MDYETIGGILVVVFGGLGIRKALAAGRAEQERHDDVWRTAAARVRGEVEIGKGSWLRSPPRVRRVRSVDAPVVVETVTSRDLGGGKVTSTRVTAGPIEGLADLDMRVAPRGALALGRVAKVARIAEVPTKEEAFDRRVRVHGAPHALVREMLDARLCRRILELEEGFVIGEASIVVEREGTPEEASTIVAMVSFAEAIAARWLEMVEAPRRLGDTLELARVEGEPGTLARGLRRGRLVTLEVRVLPESLETVVSFEATSGERVEVVREGLAVDRDDLVRAVDAALDADRPAGAYR